MRFGVIARADNRGLGIQTWEVVRHLDPDAVLVVRSTDSEARGYEAHLERYPEAEVVEWSGAELPQAQVCDWLAGLDVVYTAETPYDWRVAQWARTTGTRLVVHLNPEFFAHHRRPEIAPDVWWAPTSWRLDTLPVDTIVVPMPCPTDRWSTPAGAVTRALHVSGAATVGSRNGTDLVRRAWDGGIDGWDLVEIDDPRRSGITDYWTLYEGVGTLVLPRRYGGLCLPAIEACGAGVVPIMPDCDPNDTWPGPRITGRYRRSLSLPCGPVATFVADVDDLRRILEGLASGDALAHAQADALAWAEAHSWDALGPEWIDALTVAAATRRRSVATADVAVVIPWRESDGYRAAALEWVRGRIEATHPTWRVIVATDDAQPDESPWVKATAVAEGLEAADGADVIVVADADCWCDDIDGAVDAVLTSGVGWAVPHSAVRRLTPESTYAVICGGMEPSRSLSLDRSPYVGLLGGGMVVMAPSTARAVPIDPRFVGWGGEDAAWGYALRTLAGEAWRGSADLWHLWHPAPDRPSRYGSRENSQLVRRYQLARERPEKMRRLLDEIGEACGRRGPALAGREGPAAI